MGVCCSKPPSVEEPAREALPEEVVQTSKPGDRDNTDSVNSSRSPIRVSAGAAEDSASVKVPKPRRQVWADLAAISLVLLGLCRVLYK